MAGSCIDLSENVTIHLQFSDSENEDSNVSSVENICTLFQNQVMARKLF